MPKFAVLWSALAAGVATFTFHAGSRRAGEKHRNRGGAKRRLAGGRLHQHIGRPVGVHPPPASGRDLVQCRATYDVTRTPSVTSHYYKLQ
jgi:hypothetical protein